MPAALFGVFAACPPPVNNAREKKDEKRSGFWISVRVVEDRGSA
jgi:hypothetical protein